MKRVYNVTLKREYGDAVTVPAVASSSDIAIERARIHLWKKNRWYKAKEWDVIGLTRDSNEIAV